MTSDEKSSILCLRQDGYGYKAISSQLGIPLQTVISFLKKEPDDPICACLQCGASIKQKPHSKKRKFCSDKCRMLWWNSHQEKVNRQAYYRATCKQCGKVFLSYGNNHRVYCSMACYSMSRRSPNE